MSLNPLNRALIQTYRAALGGRAKPDSVIDEYVIDIAGKLLTQYAAIAL